MQKTPTNACFHTFWCYAQKGPFPALISAIARRRFKKPRFHTFLRIAQNGPKTLFWYFCSEIGNMSLSNCRVWKVLQTLQIPCFSTFWHHCERYGREAIFPWKCKKPLFSHILVLCGKVPVSCTNLRNRLKRHQKAMFSHISENYSKRLQNAVLTLLLIYLKYVFA